MTLTATYDAAAAPTVVPEIAAQATADAGSPVRVLMVGFDPDAVATVKQRLSIEGLSLAVTCLPANMLEKDIDPEQVKASSAVVVREAGRLEPYLRLLASIYRVPFAHVADGRLRVQHERGWARACLSLRQPGSDLTSFLTACLREPIEPGVELTLAEVFCNTMRIEREAPPCLPLADQRPVAP